MSARDICPKCGRMFSLHGACTLEINWSEIQGIAEVLKLKRQQKGFTLRDLSKITGISNPMLSQYENGKSEPSFERAAKLAEILDFSLDKVASYVLKNS